MFRLGIGFDVKNVSSLLICSNPKEGSLCTLERKKKECGNGLVSERRRETRLARKQRVINAIGEKKKGVESGMLEKVGLDTLSTNPGRAWRQLARLNWV